MDLHCDKKEECINHVSRLGTALRSTGLSPPDCRKQNFRKRRQNASNKLALKLINLAYYQLLARRREGMTYGAGQ
ncbi:hypothetical protein TNCV_231691 [Trichonephila clavipes]|nr:hypothetical protein TNCV_231691 [Trichonephila clavipes]